MATGPTPPTPIPGPAPAPAPDPSRPPAAGDVRAYLERYRDGQSALSALAKHLNPMVLYSEDSDPRPVWYFYKGEWREIKPQSLLKLSDPPPVGSPGWRGF